MPMKLNTLSISEIYRGAGSADKALSSVMEKAKSGIESFSCNNSRYHEEFLKEKALSHEESGTSKTYLMLNERALVDAVRGDEPTAPIVAAYFTVGISSIGVESNEISSKNRKMLRRSSFVRDGSIGCFVIGELCRADGYGSPDLPGLAILDECLGVIGKAREIIGGKGVLVDSRDVLLEKLYGERGFKKLKPTGRYTADGAELYTSFLKL